MTDSFTSGSAFRRSLEDRLRNDALSSGVPLDRLRKEAAGQRFLARMARTLPSNNWALKGGLALIYRMQKHVRATKDIDATWKQDATNLFEMLSDAAALDLGDFFEFIIAPPAVLHAETSEGGFRFGILALLDGREFARLQLDINVVEDDVRPFEKITARNLFAFADLTAPEIPIIPVSQHLAEKLHAYCRDYGGQENSRVKDLHDMLVIAEKLPIPEAGELLRRCKETFALRSTQWPPVLRNPPEIWSDVWSAFVVDYELQWRMLANAFSALEQCWLPLLQDVVNERSSWDGASWKWEHLNAGDS